MADSEAPASTAGRDRFVQSKPAPAEIKLISEWAALKKTSEFDLAGLRVEAFHNAHNAESTEADFDAALAKFRGTPIGYQVLGGAR